MMQDSQFQLLTEMFQSVENKIDNKVDGLRIELKSDIQSLRVELKEDLKSIRTELKTEIQEVRSELKTDFRETRLELKDEIRDLRHFVEADRDKLQEVYESRNHVTVRFTRSWATASFFIALISPTIVLSVTAAFLAIQ